MSYLSLKDSIVLKILTVVIATAILAPSFVKLSHLNTHKDHLVCDGYSDIHIHTKDLDCDFQKFKLSKELYIIFEDTSAQHELICIYSSFTFKQDIIAQKRLYFSLRAPPNIKC